MMKLPAHKNLDNPPGQIVNPIPKTLAEDIQQETKKVEQEEKSLGQVAWEAYMSRWPPRPPGPCGWRPKWSTAPQAYKVIWEAIGEAVVKHSKTIGSM